MSAYVTNEAHGNTITLDCSQYVTTIPPTANSQNGSPATISVVTATYGSNCAQVVGNETQVLKQACDGQTTCSY